MEIRGLLIHRVEKKSGVKMSNNSEKVANTHFDKKFGMCNGFEKVGSKGKIGYIDINEKLITPIKYDDGDEFFCLDSKMFFARVKLNEKWGIINQFGKEITEIKYDYIWKFKNGVARFKLNGKYGFVNIKGEEITLPKYDNAYDFKNNFAIVELNGKCGFINIKGEEITDIKYDDAKEFYYNIGRVKLNSKWGYINSSGLEITNIKYDVANIQSDGKKALAICDNNYVSIDLSGNESSIK